MHFAPSESENESGSESENESENESGSESENESENESGSESENESGSESENESGSESENESGSESENESGSESENESGSESDESPTSDDDDDDVKSRPKKASAPDTIDITLCCWNIKGDAKVKYRKPVTTKTFNDVDVPGAPKPTKLCQCDIICLQETTRCTTKDLLQSPNVPNKARKTLKSHIPIDLDKYGVIASREASVDNVIFYNKKRFTLMDKKIDKKFKKAFEKIKIDRKWDFKWTTEILLERIAIAFLQHHDCYLIVISIHNFSKKKGAQQVLAFTLFTFLEMLKVTGTDYPVIIAGDFNCDIKKVKLLDEYLIDYYVDEYALRPLRTTVQKKHKRIDFIVVSDESSDWDIEEPKVTAHDLKVPLTEAELEACQKKRSRSIPPSGKTTSPSGKTSSRKSRSSSMSPARSSRKGTPSTKEALHRTIINHSPLSTTLHLKINDIGIVNRSIGKLKIN